MKRIEPEMQLSFVFKNLDYFASIKEVILIGFLLKFHKYVYDF